MFTFLEMLALVESESSFGAYVCHRRPGGSIAISDLVILGPFRRSNLGPLDLEKKSTSTRFFQIGPRTIGPLRIDVTVTA